MKSKSVALLHYSVSPVVGGVERVLAAHARLMSEAGHKVTLIAGRGRHAPESVALVKIPLVDSRHPRVLAVKAELDAGRVPAEFETLADEIGAQLKPVLRGMDIVIAHNVCSLHKNLPLAAALRNLRSGLDRPRFILWHHDLAWTAARYRGELHDGHPWDILRTDWGTGHVVVSEARRAELARLLGIPAASIAVVPNGIDLAAFFGLHRETRRLLRAVPLDLGGPLLLVPVRITPRKNLELALRAFAILKDSLRDAQLVVTGPPGPHNPANAAYFEGLKALRSELGVASSFHFLAEHTQRHLPDAVVADFYRLADAVLLPSWDEGFGLPLLEAACSHLPVFCSNIAPLRELGLEEATYFPPDAPAGAVADMLLRHLREAATARFARRARAQFAWDRICSRHIDPLLQA
jgi:glycosyltransferase involved in cell wall biosynthesis